MKRSLVLYRNYLRSLLSIFFLTVSSLAYGQSIAEITCWVNQSYLDCLDKGTSVCDCGVKNPFLILHWDTSSYEITIIPAISYSWETLKSTIQQSQPSEFLITPAFGIDSGSVIRLKENRLFLTQGTQSVMFTPVILKQRDVSIDSDMYHYIHVRNCLPLLQYTFAPCNPRTNLLLSKQELEQYIAQGKIFLHCSDDYAYNEMHIRGSDSAFFMVYKRKSIILYKIPGRDRNVKVNIRNLTECQKLHKSN